MKTFKFIRHITNIVLCLFGIVWNFVSGIIGGGSYMPYIGRASYGGDAYTDIQNAAAQTANNVNFLNSYIEVIGLWMAVISIIVFLMILLKNVETIILLFKATVNERKEKNISESTKI